MADLRRTARDLLGGRYDQARELIGMAIPERIRQTARVRIFGLLQIPLIFFVGPRVIDLNDDRCVIEIDLNRRTRNHLGSLYFGVLAVGADLASGLIAKHHCELEAAREGGKKVNLVFKDFKADFLKRPEGATRFSCEGGEAIREAVAKAAETGERQNITVHVTATVPKLSGPDPVAEFSLTLSLKIRSPKSKT